MNKEKNPKKTVVCSECNLHFRTRRRKRKYYCSEHSTDFSGVYFVKEKGTNFIKIGLTESPMRYRLKNIQVGNPREVILLHFIKSKEPKLIEAFHHTKFKDLHYKGEWYKDDGTIRKYLTGLEKCL